ncbi:MAG: assimilatory sulfite reductase (NADPH) hemoprotein subunit [Xanthomonadales bacterium]|nr:assimilatory sulfite reductase (NADPH) hemoprotein subunit [Xanthomonadales bacterium]
MSSEKTVEEIKRDSHRLRGTITESLLDPVTGAFPHDDERLVKFHGSYLQDDRDLREERRRQKLEPAYGFMIRTRTPGGVVSPEQWLKLDHVATTYAERGLRITTRQAFQFHGVVKRELKATMQAINAAMIDTVAACGDVNRGIMAAANPHESRAHASIHAQAAALSKHLSPRSRAYYELWLDEERVAGSGEEDEPIYGDTYLPRKFKIGFAIPPYNDIDVFAQDLGFIAIIEDGEVAAWNVTAGGGMGATHGDPLTYPRLGSLLGSIAPDQVIAIAEAAITTQRDWGDRVLRKHARLKYTIDDRGVDAFKKEVEARSGITFAAPRDYRFIHNGDRFGWVQGENGLWHLTLRIISGRILDGEQSHLTGLREIAAHLLNVNSAEPRPEFRMTPNQNLVIANIPDGERTHIDALVAEHGLAIHETASPLRQNAIACVALPTCGLAMAEAERYLPDILARFEALLATHGLSDQPIHFRISGCPNGCSRPYLGEVALVGKAPGRYNLMLGGDHRGQRLNVLHRENIDEAAILAELDQLLARYATERGNDEYFGDFLVRSGVVVARALNLELAA